MEMLMNFAEKVLSRKFLALILATVMFFMHSITSTEWMTIALTYIGAEGMLDMLVKAPKKDASIGDSTAKK